MKVCWLLILISFLPNYSRGQQTDSTISEADSAYSYFGDTFNDAEDSRGVADTFLLSQRHFDAATLAKLKADPDLNYKETPTVAESLWDRLLAILGDLIDSLFRNAVTTDWGRVLTFAIGLVLAVGLIMMLLRVNAFKIFYKGEGESPMPYTALDENIHEMNFDRLIAEAVDKNDFRTAVRLLFLKSLKILSDKNLIEWEHGKTNHDYLSELKKDELKQGFYELNYYFEYSWYGNFSVNHETFRKVQKLFTDWSGRV